MTEWLSSAMKAKAKRETERNRVSQLERKSNLADELAAALDVAETRLIEFESADLGLMEQISAALAKYKAQKGG